MHPSSFTPTLLRITSAGSAIQRTRADPDEQTGAHASNAGAQTCQQEKLMGLAVSEETTSARVRQSRPRDGETVGNDHVIRGR